MEVSNSSREDPVLSRMALNDNKAGMQGLDKEKINKIIIEVSKGSRFYENELKKEQQVNQRIEKMMQQKEKITEQQILKAQAEVDKLATALDRGRELSRVIVHVDMDAFYAAVEMRDCPELKEKPMAVGSMSMLSTSNYHARRFGVRAAMPGFIAKKLCPSLVIVPLNFDKYKAVSKQVREIFADYDPQFMPVSLDEAYLDITEHLEQRKHWPESMRTHYICEKKDEELNEVQNEDRAETLSPVLFDDSPCTSPAFIGTEKKVVFGTCPEEAVKEMRFRIEQKTSLTASAGIAPNMMLAKVCSDKNKPNGQYIIPPERAVVMDFIRDLPVRKVSGIGKVTEKMLVALDINTCSDLSQKMAVLSLLFSETAWHHFLQISLGLGSTHIERDSERKSMSTERTFAEMNDAEEQYSLCRELCHDLAEDLKKEGIKGKTVTLKLKNVHFEVKTKALTLQCAVCTEQEIFAAAKELLKTEIDHVSPQPLRLRLMGVRVSSFISTEDKQPQQKSIVGFLKIASDSPSSNQAVKASVLKSEELAFTDSASSSTKQPEMRRWMFAGEQSKPFNKWAPESACTTEPCEQTFFQKALAKRLQKQSDQDHNHLPIFINDSDKLSKCSSADLVMTQSGVNAMTNEASHKTKPYSIKKHTDETIDTQLATTNSTIDETSGRMQSSDLLQCFTCPVCFNPIRAADLTAFNHHIDECLSGGVGGSCMSTDVGMNGIFRENGTVKTINEALSTSFPKLATSSLPTNLEHSDLRTPFFKVSTLVNEKLPDETSSNSDAIASHGAGGSDGINIKLPNGNISTLTCPVCNQVQNTDDLSIFNHHVDVCLNRDVLLELRHTESPKGQLQPEKLKDHERALNTKRKSKRRGLSPPPPSKKIKAAGTRHTIDKFFKGNGGQKL